MTRPLTALVALPAAVALLAGCAAPVSSEGHILDALAVADASMPVADLVDGAGWDRFTVLCPYERTADAADRLNLGTLSRPDLSKRDDAQAVIVVAGDGLRVTELARTRVDLCSAGRRWPVFTAGDAARATVRHVDGLWSVSPPAS